tara:strand:- start:75 stop:1154 length:1080 start_codon:yes stop_codon:yes gene_type:complete
MNKELNKEIKNILSSHHKNLKLDFKLIHITPFRANDYSFCAEIKVEIGENNFREYFIKIPKRDIAYLKTKSRKIFPISDRDRTLGKNEAESLTILRKKTLDFPSKINLINFINYSQKKNLIISEKIYGKDFFKSLRKASLFKYFFSTSIKEIDTNLFELGKFIAMVSKKESQKTSKIKYKTDKIKINIYLRKISYKNSLLNFDNLFPIRNDQIPILGDGFKGLDVRNILIDKSNNLFILDPGKSKLECVETNLARFFVTLLIIFWGSLFFFFGFKTHKHYLDSFLKGYFSHNLKVNPIILDLEIKKEILKHWELAIRALENKKWNKYFSNFLKSFYIDRFYSNLIMNKSFEDFFDRGTK